MTTYNIIPPIIVTGNGNIGKTVILTNLPNMFSVHTPHNTTQPIIQGSAVVGNEIVLPTYKEQYKYWTFLFVKRKRLNYNRYLTRGGIDYPYAKLLNDGRPHRHKFRIKRMKKAERLFKHIPRGITITQL